MIHKNRRDFLKNTIAVALSTSFTVANSGVSASQVSGDRLRDLLLRSASSVGGVPLRHQSKLETIYANRNYRPLWTANTELTHTARAILKKLEAAPLLGLHPSHYYTKVLNSWAALPDRNSHSYFELAMTDSLYEYFDNLANSQSSEKPGDPRAWFSDLSHTNVEPDAMRFFTGVATFHETIDRLQPANKNYTRLLAALHEHHQTFTEGGYTKVPKGAALKPASAGPRVMALRARLLQSGDLMNNHPANPDFYDFELEDAVKSFQVRHGLDADGVIGGRTIAELNVPVQVRIAQIEVNLDRWRWLPKDLGANNIVVNTAGFEMDVSLHHQSALKMNVVVGKRKHRTPIFSDELEHMVFRPTWNVPKSIATKELLPEEMQNPGYLDNKNIVAISYSDKSARPVSSLASHELEPSFFNSKYRLRQEPGAKNALGDVKFMFPNRYAIYLHDTNAKHLFAKFKRAFSHGCVRVEKPELLARTLLLHDGKNDYEIDDILAGGSTKTVPLSDHIPVHLTYQTSWVDDSGKVQFRPDIYDHDKHALRNYSNSRPQQIRNETYAMTQSQMTTTASFEY